MKRALVLLLFVGGVINASNTDITKAKKLGKIKPVALKACVEDYLRSLDIEAWQLEGNMLRFRRDFVHHVLMRFPSFSLSGVDLVCGRGASPLRAVFFTRRKPNMTDYAMLVAASRNMDIEPWKKQLALIILDEADHRWKKRKE